MAPSSQLCSRCETPLQSSPKMDTIIFGCLQIVIASVQLLSLHHYVSYPTDPSPLFYPMSTPLTAFSFGFLLANKNLMTICSWYVSIFNPGHLLLSQLRLSHLFLLYSLSFSLSLCLPWLSFYEKYIIPSFPVVNQKFLLGSNSHSTGVPNYFTCEVACLIAFLIRLRTFLDSFVHIYIYIYIYISHTF